MKTFIAIALLSCLWLCGCATTRDPGNAIRDAERDIAAHNIRFCYIGGWAPYAPGVPQSNVIMQYGRIAVGDQGCIQDRHSSDNAEYAEKYNQRMWKYLLSQQ